VRCAISI